MTATVSPAAAAAQRPEDDIRLRGRLLRILAGMAAGAGVMAVLLLWAGGELARQGLDDPGGLVRVGLPAARAVHDVAAALTVGLLVVAAFLAAPEPGTERAGLHGARLALTRAALLTVGVWFVSAAVVLLLTVADVAGIPFGSSGFSSVAVSFLTQVDLGRALGASLLVVAIVANLVVLATRVATVAWAAALSLLALLPLALAGHAAGSNDHDNAVDSLALHLVAVSLWVGGLGALVITAGRLGPQLPAVVRRYSTLAGWCFAVVTISGVVNAALRIGPLSNLASRYGLLVIGKVLALGLLGLAGWRHRWMTIPQIERDTGPAAFRRLASVEVGVMAATVGLAVALSRSAPPVSQVGTDPASALLGFPAPAPFTLARYLTAFHPDVVWLGIAGVAVGWYVFAVVRMARRGHEWPVHRSVCWVLGWLVLVFVTSGGGGVYGRLSFSLHMIEHMTLMIVVPILLVPAAPITLALRTLTQRRDGSLGPRELLLTVAHSRALRVLAHPLVAGGLFIVGPVLFYYTQAFPLAMFTHVGHLLMTVHFLLTGYLFVWVLIGTDPGPPRPSYPLRLLVLLAVLSFHAFFGVTLMEESSVLAADWWTAIGQTDPAALLADQQRGGAIAWSTGDVPTLVLGVLLLVGWVRSDARERRRVDRRADRDGNAELRAYNERLAALARRDRLP